MKVLLAAGCAVVVLGAATAIVVLNANDGPSGAKTSQEAADGALRALSAQDETGLLKLANPDPKLNGREAAAHKLVDDCKGSSFDGAKVDLRGGFGPEIAWGDVSVPRGKSPCRQLTLEFTRTESGWFISLGAGSPGPEPTAATNR
ncbi:hypothetical protein ABZS29_08725 [Kribbella sp. NPDC005582]|uniref:hypothetical protein n=1 Tax=Kribbella sp. NPDC005582 TaxID=3156893 RepID=UPI0033A0B49F